MKKVLSVLLLTSFAFIVKAQEDTTWYQKYKVFGAQFPRLWASTVLRTPFNDTSALSAQPGAIQAGLDGNPYWWNGIKWSKLGGEQDLSAYLKFTDSLLKYVTPNQLKDTAAAIRNGITLGDVMNNGADLHNDYNSDFNNHMWIVNNASVFSVGGVNNGAIYGVTAGGLSGSFLFSHIGGVSKYTHAGKMVAIDGNTNHQDELNVYADSTSLTFNSHNLRVGADSSDNVEALAGFIGNRIYRTKKPTGVISDSLKTMTLDRVLSNGSTSTRIPQVGGLDIFSYITPRLRIGSNSVYSTEISVDPSNGNIKFNPANGLSTFVNDVNITGNAAVGGGSSTTRAIFTLAGTNPNRVGMYWAPPVEAFNQTPIDGYLDFTGSHLRMRISGAWVNLDNEAVSHVNNADSLGGQPADYYYAKNGGDLNAGAFIGLPALSSNPATPASGARVFSDASGRLSWVNQLGYARTLRSHTLTGNRVYTFYDRDYTVADSADVAAVLAAVPVAANPGGTIGLTANNGSAGTFMRSNATPALSQNIAPNWTNAHTFSNYVNLLTGARFTSYNTTDTLSNYDRVIAAWNSNVYEMGAYYGGVGGSGNSIVRSMRLGVNTTSGASNLSTSSRTFTINSTPTVSQGVFDFSPSTTSIAGSIFTLRGAGTVSSGTQNWFTIQPTFNVTGSPTLNTLLIQPWFQAGGGGSNYLINAGTQSAADGGGTFTQRFFITSAGIGYISSRFAVGNPSATASLQISSNNSTNANYGTTGVGFVIDPASYTSSSSTGTISVGTAHSFGIPTLAASNATSLTNAATFYIAGAPAAGTNVTITNPWAAYINGNIGVNGDVLPLTNSNYNLGNSSFRWNQASIITTLTNFIKPVSGSDVSVRNFGGSDVAKFFGTTANLVLQNGGTLTDNGYRLDVQGTARITGNVTLPHIIGGSSTPSIVANTGAGTSPTISISGTDAGFTVTLTAGTSPASGADIFTVTFSNAYSASPNGVGLANINANALAVFSNVYSTPGTTTYKLSLASGVALTAGQQYKWSVTLIQ